MFLDVPPVRARDLFAATWSESDWRLRLRPGTWAGLLGEYLERRPSRR
jgi:hypothetical protein